MTNEETAKLIRALLLIVAMFFLLVPEPSGATKWISGFLFGAIVI